MVAGSVAGPAELRVRKRDFRTDIQGLRAIAVSSVVLYHAGVPFLPGGFVGVDIFFVISGFLITSHLLDGLLRDGRVRFASFYARRARRILPASFAVLVLSIIAALAWSPPLLMREVWQGAVATAVYVPNYLFAAQGTDYLSEQTPSLFQQYWSLGVEEQFYLLWPALLALGFIFVKSRRWLFLIVTAVVVTSFAACVWLTYVSQPWAFFSLPTRAWELGVGGLAAFLLARRPQPLQGWAAAILGWVGIVGIVASIALFSGAMAFPGFWAAVPVVSTALVIVTGASATSFGPTNVLSMSGMMFVGAISYSLYLVHWPMLIVPQAAVGYQNPLPLWVTLLLGATSVPVAWLMYRLIENPARNLPWLARARPRRSLLLSAAASVATVALATAVFTYSESRPLSVPVDAPPLAVSDPPVASNVVPRNLSPSLRAAARDQPVIYADGCHVDQSPAEPADCLYGDAGAPRIVLFGDSHAAQWFPAIREFAEKNGYAVEPHTKSSCPSVTGEMLNDGVPYTSCAQWREAVIEHINTTAPALVVISNRGASAGFAVTGDARAGAWDEALSKTLEAITVPVVILADTPDLGDTPSVCLSANLENAVACGEDREVAMGRTMNRTEATVAERYGAPVIDLTDFICDADWCAPVLGDTLVYRDGNHITATFSRALADPLAAELTPVWAQLVPSDPTG